ncbi:1-phosphofructokinase family hexose kinase [Hydrogenophaga sp. A37]|uniref:1-phosphofructokinase family hexose kinase n=1 Tax=Hydrogenophaga sp. A37 TaxID=1945864 RepID=UPI0009878204|nr:1-phosphofructokinase family hexose kinase [Hydrogenophaga sp. A37]OOG87305.1 phosphofructokinase [Hydrogenophaga sp. A37]
MNTSAPLPRVLCLTMNPAVDLATETERVVPTHKLRCGDTLHDAGGGGINVARVLHRLGGQCTALCPTGGSSGQWLERRMRDEGLNGVFLPIADETRVSFTVHEHSTGAEYRFVMPGPHLTDSEWQACLDHLERLPDFPELLVASGSLPPGVPADFYARLARLCQKRSARMVLDTSGPSLAAALAVGVYLFKPNLKELAELAGRPLDTAEQWQAAARQLVLDGQAEVVALTLGHLGALLVTRDAMWRAAPLDIPVASAVGAGDSFVGGLVWGLQQGQPLEQAFSWGIAAGSAALLSAGTGLSDLDDIRRLQPMVQITPVA